MILLGNPQCSSLRAVLFEGLRDKEGSTGDDSVVVEYGNMLANHRVDGARAFAPVEQTSIVNTLRGGLEASKLFDAQRPSFALVQTLSTGQLW